MLRKSNYLSNRTIQGGVGWALEDLFLTHGRGTELEGLTGNKIPCLNGKKKHFNQIEISKSGTLKKKKGEKKKCKLSSEMVGDRGGLGSDNLKERERDRERRGNQDFLSESAAIISKSSARLFS